MIEAILLILAALWLAAIAILVYLCWRAPKTPVQRPVHVPMRVPPAEPPHVFDLRAGNIWGNDVYVIRAFGHVHFLEVNARWDDGIDVVGNLTPLPRIGDVLLRPLFKGQYVFTSVSPWRDPPDRFSATLRYCLPAVPSPPCEVPAKRRSERAHDEYQRMRAQAEYAAPSSPSYGAPDFTPTPHAFTSGGGSFDGGGASGGWEPSSSSSGGGDSGGGSDSGGSNE
jgi:uncharacterized membrane protein YgcG